MRKSKVHAAESVSYLNQALAKLGDIWEEIGILEDQRLERTDAVHHHIKDLLDIMIAEEEAAKTRLLTSIESSRKELRTLCSDLQLPFQEEEEAEGRTMLQLEKDTRTRLEAMRKQKAERMAELKALVVEDCELCDAMCCTPFRIDVDSVPSLEQLRLYRAYLDNLIREKDCRYDEFVRLKTQIILCMDDLEQTPETSFEKDVMCEDEDGFCLSNDNIASLKLLITQVIYVLTEASMKCMR
ncbi:protein regulator of cytokinesis 1-like [Diretmus argenteus]